MRFVHILFVAALLSPVAAAAQTAPQTVWPYGFKAVDAPLSNLLASGYRVVSALSGAAGYRGVTFVLDKAGSLAMCKQPDADIREAKPACALAE